MSNPFITRDTLMSAPMWSVFHGEVEDPGLVVWSTFEVNAEGWSSSDEWGQELARKFDELDIQPLNPQVHDDCRHQGQDNFTAALAYLRLGGKLCKVPDAADSPWYHLLVVGDDVSVPSVDMSTLDLDDDFWDGEDEDEPACS